MNIASSRAANGVDWRSALLARVQAQGARDVTEWARTRPSATFRELASLLGDGIAPIRLEQRMREEAEDSQTLDQFARDCFVRQVRQRLPDGWGVGANHDFREAQAFASWAAALGEGYDESKAALLRALKVVGAVPTGWVPEGPCDPVISALFSAVGFARS